MEGKLYMDNMDVFNVLSYIRDCAKSQEEYDIYTKACNTWFSKQDIANNNAIVLPIEYTSVTFNKKGNIIIKNKK